MPTGYKAERCERDLKIGTEWKANHPARGITPEQYRENCQISRIRARVEAEDKQAGEQRLKDAGWNDTVEMLRVLLGYNDETNPYSMDKFNEDLAKLRAKRNQIAAGTACVGSASSI